MVCAPPSWASTSASISPSTSAPRARTASEPGQRWARSTRSRLSHRENSSSTESLVSYGSLPPSDDEADGPGFGGRSRANEGRSRSTNCVLTFALTPPTPPATNSSPQTLFSGPKQSSFPSDAERGLGHPTHAATDRARVRNRWPSHLLRAILSDAHARTALLVALLIFLWAAVPLYATGSSARALSPVVSFDRKALQNQNHKQPFQPPPRPPATANNQHSHAHTSSAIQLPPVHESLDALILSLTPAEFALREWIYDVRTAASRAADETHGSLEREADIVGDLDKWHRLLEEEEGGPIPAALASEADEALRGFVAETTSVLSLPSVFSIAINFHSSLDPATTQQTLSSRPDDDLFACARQLAGSHARPDQMLVYFLSAEAERWLNHISHLPEEACLLVSGLRSRGITPVPDPFRAAEQDIVAHTDAAVTVSIGADQTLSCIDLRAPNHYHASE